MKIKNASMSDLPTIMPIFETAKALMRRTGNMTQWTNGYPSVDLIKADIANHTSFVCMEGDQIVGVFTFIRGEDPTYLKIYDGRWLNDEPYGVVHRIASSGAVKGVAAFCLDWCMGQCGNLRIDTHRDNVIMHSLLLKNGFTQCGVIYLADGAERIAYQKIV